MKSQSGRTLLEMLLVMAILAVVAALLLPCVVRTYKAARTKLAGVQLFHKLQLAQELDQ